MIRSGYQAAAAGALIVALAAGAVGVAASQDTPPPAPAATFSAPATPSPGSIQDQLRALPVRVWSNAPGYSRAQFGLGKTGADWPDTDGNGCDQRNDTLRRDLADVMLKPGRKPCIVLSGTLRSDPYTGRSIPFRYGPHSGDVQIEHIVALKDAWLTGASSWTSAKRLQLATDPDNLTSVDGPQNASKGDDDAASWLVPLNPAYRCTYVQHQIVIKFRYGLSVTQVEYEALAKGLRENCR